MNDYVNQTPSRARWVVPLVLLAIIGFAIWRLWPAGNDGVQAAASRSATTQTTAAPTTVTTTARTVATTTVPTTTAPTTTAKPAPCATITNETIAACIKDTGMSAVPKVLIDGVKAQQKVTTDQQVNDLLLGYLTNEWDKMARDRGLDWQKSTCGSGCVLNGGLSKDFTTPLTDESIDLRDPAKAKERRNELYDNFRAKVARSPIAADGFASAILTSIYNGTETRNPGDINDPQKFAKDLWVIVAYVAGANDISLVEVPAGQKIWNSVVQNNKLAIFPYTTNRRRVILRMFHPSVNYPLEVAASCGNAVATSSNPRIPAPVLDKEPPHDDLVPKNAAADVLVNPQVKPEAGTHTPIQSPGAGGVNTGTPVDSGNGYPAGQTPTPPSTTEVGAPVGQKPAAAVPGDVPKACVAPAIVIDGVCRNAPNPVGVTPASRSTSGAANDVVTGSIAQPGSATSNSSSTTSTASTATTAGNANNVPLTGRGAG